MFERSAVIIRDRAKLSFDYVPEKLVGRESQMDSLAMLFAPVVSDGLSETAFITGPVGTGKTATAKRFCMDMADHCAGKGIRMDYVFVNCRQKSTEAGVLLQLLRHYDPGFPDRGFSPAEMYRSLLGLIRKSASRLVIVLDEADVLIKKGSGDLVYQLSRSNEEMGAVRTSVSLIMISQEYILDRLDDASRSSFKRANVIRFPRYDREGLLAIVRARAEEAIVHEGADDDALSLIADIASEIGDARLAVELLDKSARIAESKTLGIITAEDVRESNDMSVSEFTKAKLESLDRNRLLAMLAVSRSIKTRSSVTLAAAEKTYHIACEEFETPARKHTQFWTYIRDLEKLGFVVTTMVSDESGGRTKAISIRDIPAKTLSSMIEELLG